MFDEISIPFVIEEVYQGFAKCEGVIRTERNKLILEFQTKDNFVGMIKSGLKTIRLEPSMIAGIEVKKKFFTTRMIIRTKSMQPLQDIPGISSAILTLKLSGKDELEARQLVSNVMHDISEEKLKNAEKY